MTSAATAAPMWLECHTAVPSADLHSAAARTWDAVVVGAGVVGLCAAIELLRTGRSVCVVDALEIGEGTTGRATAKATSAQGSVNAEIAQKHGDAVAVAYQQANDAGYSWLADVVTHLSDDVGWTPTDHVIYSDTNSHLMESSALVARTAGVGVRHAVPPVWTSASALTWGKTSLVQPVALARELARYVRNLGGDVVTNTQIVDVAEKGAVVRLHTRQGPVLSATFAVIASQIPIYDPALLVPRMSFTWHCAAAVACSESQPIPTSFAIGADGISTRPATLPDGQPGAVVVGPDVALDEVADESAQHTLRAWIAQALPGAEVRYEWTARDGQSPGLVPVLYTTRRHPQVWIATGMNSWGFTNAAAMAAALPHLLSGPSVDAGTGYWHVGADTSPLRVLDIGAHVVGTELQDSVKSLAKVDPADVPAGMGVVTGGPVHPRALARTKEGMLHEVSARCTHMGCLVKWNMTDQLWECPCHASRFRADGAVLAGPATKPLEPLATDTPLGASA